MKPQYGPIQRGALLRQESLSRQVVVITKWRRVIGRDAIYALEKHDVTDDFRELRRRRVRLPKESD